MLNLYKFRWDCRRQGHVEGLFVADTEDVAEAIGHEVYFGEILGKHSEVYGILEDADLKVISDDQNLIKALIDACDGEYTISGYNPVNQYMCDKDNIDDEEDD